MHPREDCFTYRSKLSKTFTISKGGKKFYCKAAKQIKNLNGFSKYFI